MRALALQHYLLFGTGKHDLEPCMLCLSPVRALVKAVVNLVHLGHLSSSASTSSLTFCCQARRLKAFPRSCRGFRPSRGSAASAPLKAPEGRGDKDLSESVAYGVATLLEALSEVRMESESGLSAFARGRPRPDPKNTALLASVAAREQGRTSRKSCAS